jgi:hypothetical protein
MRLCLSLAWGWRRAHSNRYLDEDSEGLIKALVALSATISGTKTAKMHEKQIFDLMARLSVIYTSDEVRIRPISSRVFADGHVILRLPRPWFAHSLHALRPRAPSMRPMRHSSTPLRRGEISLHASRCPPSTACLDRTLPWLGAFG